MRYLIILLGLLCIGASNYEATVTKVYDGDTIRCDVDVWPGDYKSVGIRVLGIDTPEKNFPFGKVVKEYAKEKIPVGSTVYLNNVSKDKYFGRAVAEVIYCANKVGDTCESWDIWANHLLLKGYAKPYMGKSKAGLWSTCELEMNCE